MMEEPKLQVPQWDKREKSLPVSEEEQQPAKCPINIKACEIIHVAYMASGIFLALRLDVVERWWQLLLVVFFCIVVGGFFGIMASAGQFYEED